MNVIAMASKLWEKMWKPKEQPPPTAGPLFVETQNIGSAAQRRIEAFTTKLREDLKSEFPDKSFEVIVSGVAFGLMLHALAIYVAVGGKRLAELMLEIFTDRVKTMDIDFDKPSPSTEQDKS
jgi:hypothetical protein